MWEHCPKTTHRFIAFAQHLDDRKGVNAAAKWQDILVSSHLQSVPVYCVVWTFISLSACLPG